MKTNSKKSSALAIAAVFGMCAIPPILQAQGSNLRGQLLKDIFPSQNQPVSIISNNLNQNVYMLDTLADQMVFRYGWSIKSKKDNLYNEALQKHMKRHAVLTNSLVKASRGKSTKVFEKAAEDVRNSVNKLKSLQKNADVGPSVSKMIENSSVLADYVCANTAKFNVGKPIFNGKLLDKLKPVFRTEVSKETPYFALSYPGTRGPAASR